MVNFQFLSGLNTIGSNIIDIQSEEGRVIFDYGEIIDSEFGSLPDLNHTIENTAIFISHLHIDHIGSLKYVPANIPIYMSKESKQLYEGLIEVGEEKAIQAEVFPVDYEDTVTIGDIQVTFKESDHDIRGVCAFFVQTPDLKIINSGDVRLTGNRPETVKKWVAAGKEFQPDLFLLESTAFSFVEDEEDEVQAEEITEELKETISVEKVDSEEEIAEEKPKISSEAELYDRWTEFLEENQQKVTFLNGYIRDPERLVIFSKLASNQGKKMVFEPKYAYVLEKIENYMDYYVLQDLDTEEQYKENWISLAEMKKDPGNYILQNSFENRSLMKEFSAGIYGHSNGEPLGDYDPRYEVLLEEIEANNFTFEHFGASGHASKEDLLWLAENVNAKTTIPWHGMQPEALYKELAAAGLNAYLPERDVVYGVSQKSKIK